MKFTSKKLFNKMVKQTLSEGLNPELIPKVSSIQSEVVPADQFFLLHELGHEYLPPGCALRVGANMEMDDYGVLGLSWKTCSIARDLFDRSVRYFNLLTNTYVFRVEDRDGISRIYLDRPAYRTGIALSNEATFSATVTVIQLIIEKDIWPVEVCFQHAPHFDESLYTDRFCCDVLFNEAHNYIAYKTNELNMRTAKADESIHNFLKERMNEEAKGIEVNSNKFLSDIKELTIKALPSGIPSVEQISEHLCMSKRSLTRRLSACGYNFRNLMAEIQQEISEDLLKNSNQSIGEIAFQTGFSDQSAFNRAFKRWNNLSPIEYRKNNRPIASGSKCQIIGLTDQKSGE